MEMLTPTATGSKPQATARLTFITSLGRCVDTELSLLGEKPKLGKYGNRRKADRVACETMDLTGCSIGDINEITSRLGTN